MQANQHQGQEDVERRRALNDRIVDLINTCTKQSLFERLVFTAAADNLVKPTRIGEVAEWTQLQGIRTGDDDDEVFAPTIDISAVVLRQVAKKLGFRGRSSSPKGDICQDCVAKWINDNNNAAADDSDEGEGEDEGEESDEEEDDENDNIFNNNNINNAEDEEEDVINNYAAAGFGEEEDNNIINNDNIIIINNNNNNNNDDDDDNNNNNNNNNNDNNNNNNDNDNNNNNNDNGNDDNRNPSGVDFTTIILLLSPWMLLLTILFGYISWAKPRYVLSLIAAYKFKAMTWMFM